MRPILCIDHNGRAGNGFFQTIFDQHSEILTCPWVHYAHSYAISGLGEREIDAKDAHKYWIENSYFKYIFNDLDEKLSAEIIKFGGDPNAPINRDIARSVFKDIVLYHERITPKLLILASYFAYAHSVGRDLSVVKFVLLTDAISLRTENWFDGISGKVVDYVMDNYCEPVVIQLQRDPRAAFASSVHQSVNELSNMYGIRFGNYFRRLIRLINLDLDTGFDSIFVFGTWIVYFRKTFEAIEAVKSRYTGKILVIRNEDLNLNFIETVTKFCDFLGVELSEQWKKPKEFVPTMLAMPWKGTGAYNNAYQKFHYGPLPNDTDIASQSVIGPNSYVTQRWRKRLLPTEIFLIEWLLEDEFRAYDIQPLYLNLEKRQTLRFILNAFIPLSGELPTLKWIKNGKFAGGVGEVLNRLFFAITYSPFYVVARVALFRLAFGRFSLSNGRHAKR